MSPMPAGQAPGCFQNKHLGMTTLTFAFHKQALGEGGGHVPFCRLVTRQEMTCSVQGVWDHVPHTIYPSPRKSIPPPRGHSSS